MKNIVILFAGTVIVVIGLSTYLFLNKSSKTISQPEITANCETCPENSLTVTPVAQEADGLGSSIHDGRGSKIETNPTVTIVSPEVDTAVQQNVVAECISCNENSPTVIPAFPGAEGFGAYTPGGRGGRVIEVTNLNDGGPGSFRAALEAQGPRIVVFRIGGRIELKSSVKIRNPYITIAGQTAPGDGITTSGEEVIVLAHDVIIRHMRFRLGDVEVQADGGDNRDALNFGNSKGETYNVIVDHVSASWAVDENLALWYPTTHDITIQYSITSEALYDSFHEKGPHSKGLLIGDDINNVSVHHNLFAHNDARNPLIKGGLIDFRNNIIYNSGHQASHMEGRNNKINLINNFYKKGINADRSYSGFEVRVKDQPDFRLFIDGNIGWSDPTGGRNWDMIANSLSEDRRVSKQFDVPTVATLSAKEAYELVLSSAGNTIPKRDAVDQRVVNDVRNGTGTIIDSQSEVGGWPDYRSGTSPTDSDHDGVPDEWEVRHGMNPNDRSDGKLDRDNDGYTNVEEYINKLAGDNW
jgi:pectate lyase